MTNAEPLTAHLAHLALRTPDVERAARFYERAVGMRRHGAGSDGALELGWGSGHPALRLSEGAHGIDHVALEVPDLAVCEALLARLDGAGALSAPLAGDGDAHAATVDPDGNRVLILGQVDRCGERTAGPGRRPVRIQHVTFASPDVAATARFYADVLGFRVSDRMGDVFTWLRCDPEHHTIAVVAAPTAGLDHYSFDVEGWDALKTWCDELAAKDVPITWGPGRHGPGNNLFVMFDDPDGTRIELSAEMERYWDEQARYEPRVWEPHPRTTNLWGPNPAWRTVTA